MKEGGVFTEGKAVTVYKLVLKKMRLEVLNSYEYFLYFWYKRVKSLCLQYCVFFRLSVEEIEDELEMVNLSSGMPPKDTIQDQNLSPKQLFLRFSGE